MDEGTITEFQTLDGLGWITSDAGNQIRFGPRSFAGFVPHVGQRVRIMGTEVGYRGVIKATRLVPVTPEPVVEKQAVKRDSVARLDALGLTVDDALRRVLERWDADDQFNADLEACGFWVDVMLADEIDCHVPSFVVIAMNGSGSAYGVFLEPRVLQSVGRPWVYWEHEDDRLHYLARDTASFFAGYLDYEAGWLSDASPVARIRRVLSDLGIDLPAPGTSAPSWHEGQPADWLPKR